MPLYKLDFAYTPETWAAVTKAPENRREAVRRAAEGSGGRLIDLYFSFGEYDGFALFEAPNSTTAAAVAITVVGSGRFRAVKTTEVFTPEEAEAAMRQASSMGYQPPGGG